MKVTVRDFDPIKDINPTFVLNIGGLKPKIYLSDIRTKFRKWIINQDIKYCRLSTPFAIVSDFIKTLNAEIEKSDLKRLTVAFGGDIQKRILGTDKHSDFVNI